jgi:hypothetical protein
VLRATGSFKSLVWAQAGYAAAIIAGGILAAPIGVNAIAAVVSITAGSFFLAMSLLACKRAAAPLSAFVAAHMHGMLLGLLAAISLGTIVFFLRAVNAPDYAILLASGSAIALTPIGAARIPPAMIAGSSARQQQRWRRTCAPPRPRACRASAPAGPAESRRHRRDGGQRHQRVPQPRTWRGGHC